MEFTERQLRDNAAQDEAMRLALRSKAVVPKSAEALAMDQKEDAYQAALRGQEMYKSKDKFRGEGLGAPIAAIADLFNKKDKKIADYTAAELEALQRKRSSAGLAQSRAAQQAGMAQGGEDFARIRQKQEEDLIEDENIAVNVDNDPNNMYDRDTGQPVFVKFKGAGNVPYDANTDTVVDMSKLMSADEWKTERPKLEARRNMSSTNHVTIKKNIGEY